MDEETHKRWWPLHRRAALGETLNAEEQAFYQAGVCQLDAEEEQALSGSVERLRQARRQVQESREEYRRLQAQLEEMEAQIAVLEARLDEPTKQLLGVGN